MSHHEDDDDDVLIQKFFPYQKGAEYPKVNNLLKQVARDKTLSYRKKQKL
jgi:hypothetical protein